MKENRSLIVTVVTLTITRLFVNMTRRFAYPFVPTIARQLAVPISSVQTVIAIQGTSGLLSPALGAVIERYKRKHVMIVCLLGMTVAALFGAALPAFIVFGGVMFAFGLAKSIYDPTMYAYLGDNTPYNRRGLALGFGELSWAGSLLVAAPLAGLLLARSELPAQQLAMLAAAYPAEIPLPTISTMGIQSVMLMFALVSLIGATILVLNVPASQHRKSLAGRGSALLNAIRLVGSNRNARGAIGYALALAIANEILFINYGIFMESTFQLSLAVLGSVTIVISAAEVVGEFIVIFFADRIGKRRLALAGSLVSTTGYLLLPFTDFSLVAALLLLFIIFIGVETAIVSSLPLFTEMLPDNRVVMMSSVVGTTALGRVLGAVLGGFIFGLTGSFLVIGLVSTIIGALSFFSMWRYVEE